MNITKIISKTFDSRLKQIDLYASQASEIQHRVLSRLTRQAAQTEWGRKYDYSSIRNYEDFRKTCSYPNIRRNQTLCRTFASRGTESALAIGDTLVCKILRND